MTEIEYWADQANRMGELERSCRELKESWHQAVQEIKAIRKKEGYSNDRKWRPSGWENPYKEWTSDMEAGLGVYQKTFEEGADAMLDALFELAKESPTGTFTIDSHVIYIR